MLRLLAQRRGQVPKGKVLPRVRCPYASYAPLREHAVDMDMDHGQGHGPWTWTWTMDMDMDMDSVACVARLLAR